MLKTMIELSRLCRPVSLYTNRENTETFHYGIILAVNESEVAINQISPNGDDDGISVFSVEKVYRIEFGGQYEKKMKVLCDRKQIPERRVEINGKSILLSVLQYAFQTKQIISLSLVDSGCEDVVGIPIGVQDGEWKIQSIDEYGFLDGISYVKEDSMTGLTMSREEEKRIAILYHANYDK